MWNAQEAKHISAPASRNETALQLNHFLWQFKANKIDKKSGIVVLKNIKGNI